MINLEISKGQVRVMMTSSKIPDVLGVGKVTLAIMTDQRDDLIRD